MILARYRKSWRALKRRRTAKSAWGWTRSRGSTKMKPGTRLLHPELLTVVAEGVMIGVLELHQRFDHELTLMLFRLLASTG